MDWLVADFDLILDLPELMNDAKWADVLRGDWIRRVTHTHSNRAQGDSIIFPPPRRPRLTDKIGGDKVIVDDEDVFSIL